MYGRGESVSGEEGVGEFEESVGPAMEAFIERAAEAVENVVGFHDASIMPSPNASRILYMPTELKHNSPLKYACPPGPGIGCWTG